MDSMVYYLLPRYICFSVILTFILPDLHMGRKVIYQAMSGRLTWIVLQFFCLSPERPLVFQQSI